MPGVELRNFNVMFLDGEIGVLMGDRDLSIQHSQLENV